MQFPLGLQLSDRALAIRLPDPHDCVGWTLVGGGVRTVSAITWSFGTSADLTVDIDAEDWLRTRVAAMGCDPDATAAFITSRDLERHVTSTVEADIGAVTAIATVGLSNALRAGDPAVAVSYGPGTINVAVILPRPATCSALLETLGLAQEAKTAVVLGSGVLSLVSREPATGTGTDALVVAAPQGTPGGQERPVQFAGKHTSLGSAVGRAVMDAVGRGVDAWNQERGTGPQPGGAAREVSGRGRLVLVGGGVRSGKSAFAERRALAFPRAEGFGPPVYVATAQAFDDEMGDRIQKHRDQRGQAFETIEESVELVQALKAVAERNPAVVLVDCLTLWLSNLLCRGIDDVGIELHCMDLVDCVRVLPVPIVLVTNEVGLGLVPETPLGRRFRDATGRLHQALSSASDEVYFAALGTVLRIKPGPVVPAEPPMSHPHPGSTE